MLAIAKGGTNGTLKAMIIPESPERFSKALNVQAPERFE